MTIEKTGNEKTNHVKKCPECDGTGTLHVKCPKCNGTGTRFGSSLMGGIPMTMPKPCYLCEGRGKVHYLIAEALEETETKNGG